MRQQIGRTAKLRHAQPLRHKRKPKDTAKQSKNCPNCKVLCLALVRVAT